MCALAYANNTFIAAIPRRRRTRRRASDDGKDEPTSQDESSVREDVQEDEDWFVWPAEANQLFFTIYDQISICSVHTHTQLV